jgi:hypothetical protein
MKNRNWILLVLSLSTVFASCKKENEEPEPEPVVTYSLTAKLDGSDFKSNADIVLDDGIFYIEAENSLSKNNFLQIMVDIDSMSVNKTYMIGDFSDLAFNSGTYAYATFTSSVADFFTSDGTNPSTDKLTITKFDTISKTISGEFNFQVNDGNGVLRTFTSGKFTDLKW